MHTTSKLSYLIDLDGTVFSGNCPIDYAAEFFDYLNSGQRDYLVLTNTPDRSAEDLSDKMKQMGIRVEKDRIITAAQTAACFLKEQNLNTVYVVGNEILKNELRSKGLKLVRKNPEAVLIGFDNKFNFEKMKVAVKLISQGAKFICTNPDYVCPMPFYSIPHTGSIAIGIQAATGIKPIIIGKPEKYMFDKALKILGCKKEDCCIIGDNIDTDILFARNNEIISYLVLTGVTNESILRNSIVKPTHVFKSLKDIIVSEISGQ
jgi:4-nitrophenyl phosphatase